MNQKEWMERTKNMLRIMRNNAVGLSNERTIIDGEHIRELDILIKHGK